MAINELNLINPAENALNQSHTSSLDVKFGLQSDISEIQNSGIIPYKKKKNSESKNKLKSFRSNLEFYNGKDNDFK
tara:strand:- start:216 stop:443 length:228 start_codon:yes stop_codon:yes gene_type:complete